MGLRVREDGGSECLAVMVGIGVQTLPHPKGEQTSSGSFVTRELEREAETGVRRYDGGIDHWREPAVSVTRTEPRLRVRIVKV